MKYICFGCFDKGKQPRMWPRTMNLDSLPLKNENDKVGESGWRTLRSRVKRRFIDQTLAGPRNPTVIIFLAGIRLQRPVGAISGIVYQDVDSLEAFEPFANRRIDSLHVCHVKRGQEDVGKVREILGSLRVTSGCYVPPTAALKEFRGFIADATGCTRYQCSFCFCHKTSFLGRSFDFNNDEQLSEYQPLVKKLFAGMKEALAKASEASLVTETIYKAAVDGSSQLRYVAGADAEALLAQRGKEGDATFLPICCID